MQMMDTVRMRREEGWEGREVSAVMHGWWHLVPQREHMVLCVSMAICQVRDGRRRRSAQ